MSGIKKKSLSLAVKLQLLMFCLLLIVFAVIAWQTVSNVKSEYAKYHQKRLLRKATTINSTLDYLLFENKLNHDSINWVKEVSKIADINRINLVLFNSSQQILASTADPSIIDKATVEKLSNELEPGTSVIEEKSIDKVEYLASFSKIRNGNDFLILEVPYFNSGKDSSEEIRSLIIQLVEIYFAFLLIVLLVTPFLVNRLMKTLNLVREKMHKVQIGGKNEKININSNDELGQLVNEYNRMIDELEESTIQLKRIERENAWKEIAQQIAHEIKNPLTPMKLSIQHLLRVGADDSMKLKIMLEKVSKTLIEQIDHLAKIASEFSNFARLPDPVLETLNLYHEIEHVVSLYREHEHVQVQFDGDNNLFAKVDKVQFNRLMHNLIKNAAQATIGTPDAIIKVGLKNINDQIQIFVEDNGEGIPKDLKTKIFMPNFSTKSSGMGIGLAMCKRIVEGFGGKIEFESEAQKGAVFYIYLSRV